MKALMNIAMIPCKQAALLGAKQSFKALSMWEGVKLRLHSKMCGACKSFGQDSHLIDQAIDKLLAVKADEKLSLTEDQRKKILEALG